MGFFDKIKNMFIEEVDEDDDVKVEKIKSDVTHVAIETPSSVNIVNSDFDDEYLTGSSRIEKEPQPMKPIFFTDSDFESLDIIPEEKPKRESRYESIIENNEVKEEPKEKVVDLKEPEIEEKKIFKPTPIISPVYGILDKNYHKEDIVSKNEVRQEEVVEPSIDSIRNKAYGTLEDELENTLFGKSALFSEPVAEETSEINDDKLTALTDDISKELDELLLKKEVLSEDEMKENIKKNKDINEEDLLGFIDSTLYKDGDEENDN